MDLERLIADFLAGASKPVTAREIARLLSCSQSCSIDVSSVNSNLYGPLAPRVSKDSEFRWFLKSPNAALNGQPAEHDMMPKSERGSPQATNPEDSDTKGPCESLPHPASPIPTSAVEAKEKLTSVYGFLRELHDLRNPVTKKLVPTLGTRISDWPAHESIRVRNGDYSSSQPGIPSSEDVDELIRVRRADTTKCPPPPDSIESWLLSGWEDCNRIVEQVRSKNIVNAEGTTIVVAFEDSADRVKAFVDWSGVREQWAANERITILARAVFDHFYAIWSMLQKEGGAMELVVEDGWLDIESQRISHPLLSQSLNLDFDPSSPEFRVSLTLEQPELFTALLLQIPDVEARALGQMTDDLKRFPVDPLGGESTDNYFKRLAQGLFRNGKFVPEGRPSDEAEIPTISRDAVIHVRKKVAGLKRCLDAILEDLQSPSVLPADGLSRIVGIDPHETSPNVSSGNAEPSQLPRITPDESQILFSKLANDEQYRIAAQLANNSNVLVQGPPGTGKTHTIANLLGHLLAQGKTVLVTAHTTKALKVLRDKVVEPLQPLCLSVLDSESESKSQLAKAAQEIVARLASCDAASMKRDAANLRKKRTDLLDAVRARQRNLRSARESEIEEIVISGTAIRPVEAAKHISATANENGWVPGPINQDFPPLLDREITELYSTNSTLNSEDECELRAEQPDSARLVSPSDFHLLAAQRDEAGAQGKRHRQELWNTEAVSQSSAETLRKIRASLQQAAAGLAEERSWLREVLFCGWAGGHQAQAWTDLVAEIEAIADEAAALQRIEMERGPEISTKADLSQTASHYAEIVAHLKGGGRLGFVTKVTKPHWSETIATSKIEGRNPQTLEDFTCLKQKCDMMLRSARFEARWRRSVESCNGPRYADFGRNPERNVLGYAQIIRRQVAWRSDVWDPLLNQLIESGFFWSNWLAAFPLQPGDHSELARLKLACSDELAVIIESQAAQLLERELAIKLSEQGAYLARYPVSQVAQVLAKSQETWSAEQYEAAFIELRRIEGLRTTYERRAELLKRLEVAAPAWRAALVDREGVHSKGIPPGAITAAWRWRLLKQELEARSVASTVGIESKIRALEEQIHSVTSEIIEKDTWAAQKIRTNLPQQQALIGYVQTLSKITKTGRGVRDPELKRAAQKQLELARDAVPVWIMPLNRVYESFDPRTVKFDVVIIDEASQSDVTALAALYLAKEQVVVGDKEQVTPDAVGQVLSDVSRLIQTHLRGIPNSGLYDGQTSIYDLAETAFGGVVALREHFRCVPEIIQFSNHLSYNGAIMPLREPTSSNVTPALVPYRVKGSRTESGKVNEEEASTIASLIVAAIRHSEYSVNEAGHPASFAVISLLGSEQAQLIENRLKSYLTPEELNKHDVLCGTAANLQGDERDIVFLSMVDSAPDEGLLPTRASGARDIYQKRYNVAVSRARNQLWVVHSLDPDLHLNPGDLRRRLIEHARNPSALVELMERTSKRTDSEFERLVVNRLLGAGFKVETQWRVGSYRIDIVVVGSRRNLAIECDGERWHTADQLETDLRRQAILERLGWVFVRIRGSLFFRDPDSAMADVYSKISELGIEALGGGVGTSEPLSGGLVEEIKRSAESIRASWRIGGEI
jgi:very-short-patch-repair endonuclease